MKITIAILGLLLMQGCATGYHSATNPLLGLSGGFIHHEGPGDLIEVAFYGNGFTKSERTGLFLMYRCAELVKERGGDSFVMYRSIAHAIADKPEASTYISSIGYKPAAKVFILPEDSPRTHSFSAEEIIKKHTAEVKGK